MSGVPLKQLFGEQLRRARVMRGLSLRELSEKLEGKVSHAALQKYEKGLMGPDSELVNALSGLLRVRPDYFFNRKRVELAGIEFRKRGKFGKKAQDQIREEAREFFERYLEVESILEISNPDLTRIDLTQGSDDELASEIEASAKKFRAEWSLGRNPLSNVHELLEFHGIKVKEIKAGSSFDGFSGWAGSVPVVVLAKWLDRDLPRKRLTALHELGHLVLQLPRRLSTKDVELWCYRFAGALLIPEEEFKAAFGGQRQRVSLGELIALKQEWGISLAAIMRRARDLNLITASHYKYYCITASKRGWGKASPEPGRWKGSESSDRFPMLVYRATAKELITRSKAAGLLGVPLSAFDKEFTFI